MCNITSANNKKTKQKNMNTQAITSNEIPSNVLSLLKMTAEVKGKPFEKVLDDYRLQVALVAFEAQKRAWLKESQDEEEMDNQENAIAEERMAREDNDYYEWWSNR